MPHYVSPEEARYSPDSPVPPRPDAPTMQGRYQQYLDTFSGYAGRYPQFLDTSSYSRQNILPNIQGAAQDVREGAPYLREFVRDVVVPPGLRNLGTKVREVMRSQQVRPAPGKTYLRDTATGQPFSPPKLDTRPMLIPPTQGVQYQSKNYQIVPLEDPNRGSYRALIYEPGKPPYETIVNPTGEFGSPYDQQLPP